MATNQGSGQGSKDGTQASDTGESKPSSLPSLAGQFIIEIKDFSTSDLKQYLNISNFRLLCNVIMRLISLYCNMKQVHYTEEEGLPATRRTIIINDQIITNFLQKQATDGIRSQIYIDIRRPGPSSKPGPSSEPFKPPASYNTCNVYPNPIFSVSFAKKVASQPPPRPIVLQGQYKNQFAHPRGPAPFASQTQMQPNTNSFSLLNVPRSYPPTHSVPEPLPPAQSVSLQPMDFLSIHDQLFYLPLNPDYSEDLLNMIMNPVKDTLLILCTKKGM